MQRKVPEALAKKLIKDFWPKETGGTPPTIECIAITPETNLSTLPQEHGWLLKQKLVAKVDECFGKRGKLGYVKIADSFEEAQKWIEGLRGKEVEVAGRRGTLRHFLIEPFIEHLEEYYLAYTCDRTHDVILFSRTGGVNIEEQRGSVERIEVPLNDDTVSERALREAGVPVTLYAVVQALRTIVRSLDFSFLEINPLTEVGGIPYTLDAVCRVDSTAAFRQKHSWGRESLADAFGVSLTPEEQAIRKLDAESGSSLKFTLLNPLGRIWTMVAGGGASIIYADAITELSDPSELANYGEWSGNPTSDEMEEYTKNILALMTRPSLFDEAQSDKRKALVIGGGIANFTDIAKTFEGIIRALRKFQGKLHHVSLFVRRAGPRDHQGLKNLRAACRELGIPCTAFGAELPMTEIVKIALQDLALGEKNSKHEIRNVSNFGIRISDFL